MISLVAARGFELVSKYEDEKSTIIRPKRATKFSAGYDIFNNTGNDIVIKAGEISSAFTTKFKSFMGADEYLAIHVRSSHGFKYSMRLANSTGIIDGDYYNNKNNEGEIFVKFHNQGDKDLIIKRGEAMCQAIFNKFLIANDDCTDDVRDGGLGSTTKT
jgi:dUTP pyrophosphatase